MKIICPHCKSSNTYLDGDEMHCFICGELFPIPSGAVKQVVVKINNPEPICSTEPEPIVLDNFAKEKEYMKNKLGDLNNALFAQLERLGEEDTKGNKLLEEINRAKAITGVAHEIILNGKLTLDAMVAVKEKKIDTLLPQMIGMDKAENAK
jgi:hypothetical protein